MTAGGYQHLTMEETAARIRCGVDSLVLFHRHPDGDAVGSGFALCRILEALGCRTRCVCDDEVPERLQFLLQDASVGPAQDSLQWAAIPTDFSPAQIIAVDTASPAQAGRLYDTLAGRIDLMIDHHGKGEMYADGWIDGDCAATGEMIYRLSRALLAEGRISAVPAGVDRLLYAAISSDTGCFRYSNAGPSTHLAAADLLRSGFDAAEINHRLFEVKSPRLLLAEKVGFERLKLFADGRIGIVDMPFALKREHDLADEHMETLVDVARGLQGVQVAVAVRQSNEDPVYRVSMRSSCGVDVSAVCAAFGGGGHVRAAGCTVTCPQGMEAVVAMLAEALTEALARDNGVLFPPKKPT